MNYLDFDIKTDELDEITVADAKDHAEFVKEVNYLIAEGLIEIEEDANGQVRAYPAGR